MPCDTKRHSNTNKTKLKGSEIKINSTQLFQSKENLSQSSLSTFTDTEVEDTLNLTVYYNSRNQLEEIAFLSSSFDIPRKVIQAIKICLPYHKTLSSFKIKGRLHRTLLLEIRNMLPYSNITHVCLDDTFLPECNYYVLLEQISQLQYLSLRRCQINDQACKMLAELLHFGKPASKSILILNLASNFINDVGAKHLGDMLRNNRTLLHLNISANNITDEGANNILKHLLLFRIRKDELLRVKQRQVKYFYEKEEVRRKCEVEIINQLRDEEKENLRLAVAKYDKSAGKNFTHFAVVEESITNQAEKMSKKIVGEFQDPFDYQNTIQINDQLYSIGNLTLCSLNMAFNNLEYFSVFKIYDVLKYQSELKKPLQCKGLIKIVLDGNKIPKHCKKFEDIEALLELAISKNIEFSCLKQSASSLIKSRKYLQQKLSPKSVL